MEGAILIGKLYAIDITSTESCGTSLYLRLQAWRSLNDLDDVCYGLYFTRGSIPIGASVVQWYFSDDLADIFRLRQTFSFLNIHCD